jgi:hypothetical protein
VLIGARVVDLSRQVPRLLAPFPPLCQLARRLLVGADDEVLQPGPLDPPLPPAAELDRWQVAAATSAVICAVLVASSSAICGIVNKRGGRSSGMAAQ